MWSALRGQVVHGDITLDNLLIDDEEVTGVIDLGDLAHSTIVFDIAAALSSLAATLSGDALFRTLRRFLDGYRSVTPLEPEELAALGDTIAVRAAITLCISHWRAADHPENAAYIRAWDDMSLSVLRQFAELGPDEVTRRLGGPSAPPDTADLHRRRDAVFGDALAELTYTDPMHLVRGSGATLTDSSGRTYIDAYNNVPVVGHAHPRVSGAIADQARLLSINLRYLHPRAIELAERLVATMPLGARHRAPAQLRQRGDRPGLATGDGRDRSHRRPGDGLRLPRRHHGHERLLSRGVAGRLDAGTRRAVRRAARGRPRHRGVRGGRRQAARRGPRARPRHRRPALHQ